MGTHKLETRFHIIGLIVVIFIGDVIEIGTIVLSTAAGFGGLCLSSWHTDYCANLNNSGKGSPIYSCQLDPAERTFCDFTTNSATDDYYSINGGTNSYPGVELPCSSDLCNYALPNCVCNSEVECTFALNLTGSLLAYNDSNTDYVDYDQYPFWSSLSNKQYDFTFPTNGTLCVYSAKGHGFGAKEEFSFCYNDSTVDFDKETEEEGESIEQTFLGSSIVNIILLVVAVTNDLGYFLYVHKLATEAQVKERKEICHPIKLWVEFGVFLPISAINILHVVLHSVVITLIRAYDGVTCYQDSYYLVLGGRTLALAIACVDTCISTMLFLLSTKEICCEEEKEDPEKNGHEEKRDSKYEKNGGSKHEKNGDQKHEEKVGENTENEANE